MVFHTPWGFLALLSIPAILLLHFFRSRRRVMRVGGLHLWQFAPTRLPAGAKWKRIVANLPLFFELLAALLLSLLIAGIDIPRETSRNHYTIVLDDSASMSAAPDGKSFASRAVKAIQDWAPENGRYTVVRCGLTADLLAGPFAEWSEAEEALMEWHPESAGCNQSAGINLATKFQVEGGRVLFVTDEAPVREEPDSGTLVMAVGESADNIAIEFADRSRMPENIDRIYVTVKAYTALQKDTTLRAVAEGRELNRQDLTFEAGEQKSFHFDTRATDQVVRLTIDDDTVAFDNSVRLTPLRPKVVGVTLRVPEVMIEPLSRAVKAVPRTVIAPSIDQANLIFTTERDWPESPAVVRVVQVPTEKAPAAGATTGNVIILANRYEPLTQSLPLEGLIWSFTKSLETPAESRNLLSFDDATLLAYQPMGFRRGKYYLDLNAAASNVAEQPAWPILIKGLIDETRRVMPGMSRTNFRVGEDIPLSLTQPPGAEVNMQIVRDGEIVDSLDRMPPSLVGLDAGIYEIRGAQSGEIETRFAVNLFTPPESDIRASSNNEPDLDTLEPESQQRQERNMPLFFLLLILITGAIGAAWIFQDSSR